MTKTLIISGSPRKGNTEFILNKIYDSIDSDKDLLLLRTKNIKRCTGCFYCHENKACPIQDDMQEIYQKMLEADVIILGTPNYFDNVTGLTKDFIDRTNPFYETDKLKGKKLITIVVGGGKIKNSERVGEYALQYFADAHDLDVIGKYYFQALFPKDLENSKEERQTIEDIINKLSKA